MALSERERRNLYEGLEEALGPSQADTLMQLLPNEPADQLVTISYFQTEMAASRAEIGGEMADLRGELRGEMSALRTELKGDMAELRSELKGDMAELRSELKGDMATLRTDVTNEITELKGTVLAIENNLTLRFASLQSSLTRWMIGFASVNTIAVITALLA